MTSTFFQPCVSPWDCSPPPVSENSTSANYTCHSHTAWPERPSYTSGSATPPATRTAPHGAARAAARRGASRWSAGTRRRARLAHPSTPPRIALVARLRGTRLHGRLLMPALRPIPEGVAPMRGPIVPWLAPPGLALLIPLPPVIRQGFQAGVTLLRVKHEAWKHISDALDPVCHIPPGHHLHGLDA